MLREPFNAITHFLGVLLAITGLVYLVVQAEGALAITAFALYGTGLVSLYLASSLYHGLPVSRTWVLRLRKLDHTAIYLLIAGTYTPICLLALPPGWGWTIFVLVWVLAVTGIVVRNLVKTIPRWVNTVIYVVLGWVAIVGVKPLIEAFPWTGLAWLVAGGALYTLGAVVYATDWPDIAPRYVGAHGIWHLFVLAGSATHFIFIAFYVAP